MNARVNARVKCLVIAEHDHVSLNAATHSAVAAAREILRFSAQQSAQQADQQAVELELLVIGSQCLSVAQAAAKIAGVNRVWLADAEHFADQSPENSARQVLALLANEAAQRPAQRPYTHLLMAATARAKNLLPRVAALLDVAPISDIVSVDSIDVFSRPIYAGRLLSQVQSCAALTIISVRVSAFPVHEVQPQAAAPISQMPSVPSGPQSKLSQLITRQTKRSNSPALSTAKIVVVGGRGLGNAENFQQLLEPLAQKLGAAIGATRSAVDLGWASNDLQVGQSGHSIAPELYIGVGVSGAIQHLAGMQGSRVIVAINQDPEAALVQIADYALVADLFSALPALLRMLEQH